MARAYVVDASALLDELAFGTGPVELTEKVDLHAPALLDFEFGSAARRLAMGPHADLERAEFALAGFDALTIERHAAKPLMTRMWSLRENISMYDASYVALAEALGIPLLTTDLKLARAAGPHCEVIVRP